MVRKIFVGRGSNQTRRLICFLKKTQLEEKGIFEDNNISGSSFGDMQLMDFMVSVKRCSLPKCKSIISSNRLSFLGGHRSYAIWYFPFLTDLLWIANKCGNNMPIFHLTKKQTKKRSVFKAAYLATADGAIKASWKEKLSLRQSNSHSIRSSPFSSNSNAG